jgi:hypothetical protein
VTSPSSAEVKNGWSSTATPLYAFMALTITRLPFPLSLTLQFVT